jgi:hypothetical protein
VFGEGEGEDGEGLVAVEAGRGVDVAVRDKGEEVVAEGWRDWDVEVRDDRLYAFLVGGVQVPVDVLLADEIPVAAQLSQ